MYVHVWVMDKQVSYRTFILRTQYHVTKCVHVHVLVCNQVCIVCVYVRQSFLRSCEHLIGKRDHTAIITCSPCHVEEAIFWEVVSGGEAYWTLRGTCWSDVADVNRRPSFCVLPLSRYVLLEKLEQLPWTIKAISLASNEGRKTGTCS